MSLIAGSEYGSKEERFADGIAIAAKFVFISDLVCTGTGTSHGQTARLYVSDYSNRRIRCVELDAADQSNNRVSSHTTTNRFPTNLYLIAPTLSVLNVRCTSLQIAGSSDYRLTTNN